MIQVADSVKSSRDSGQRSAAEATPEEKRAVAGEGEAGAHHRLTGNNGEADHGRARQPGAITFLWVPGSRRKGDEGGKWDRRGELIGFREKKNT